MNAIRFICENLKPIVFIGGTIIAIGWIIWYERKHANDIPESWTHL
jgi:hypothetical protein